MERDVRRLDGFSEYVLQTSRVIENLERKVVQLSEENVRLRKKVVLAQYTFPFMLGAIVGGCLVVIFW